MMSALESFRQELTDFCRSCGRNPESVKLLAVSKKQPLHKIHEAYREKQLDFGENYIQEALEKMSALQIPQIRWHLIGPIQKNKINKILGPFHLIHSVDSLKIAEEINQRGQKANIQAPVLLQINLSGELSKSGQSKSELLENWSQFSSLSNLKIQGLMTMPPLQDNPENSRPYFRELKQLAAKLNLTELSMGTSHDWKVAVEEGATYIRIGTAVFGERGS